MNSLLYYYNNVQKMAAYRQAKRMQRGVLTAQGGFSTTDPALRQMPCTIQCVFVAKEFRSERTQIVLDTRGDSAGPRIDITTSNDLFVASNYTSISKPATLDKIYDVVFAVSKDSTDVYIDGEKEATLASGEAQMTRLYLGANSAVFYGDWLMYRQFNYLMNAEEVKALDNNNDPMGYVVPKAMRGLEPVEIVGNNSNTWTGTEDPTYTFQINVNPEMKDGHAYLVNVSISNYEAGTPLIWEGTRQIQLPEENGNFDVLIRPTSGYTKFILIYGGYIGTDRRLTLTVNSITPVGLLAEYLPQNLMYGRDDKTIATSWLDSAKQLPLSDEYMEPLFQSIGGYDMTANGAPEILYNE